MASRRGPQPLADDGRDRRVPIDLPQLDLVRSVFHCAFGKVKKAMKVLAELVERVFGCLALEVAQLVDRAAPTRTHTASR
jgi:hypothetical protein